MDLFALGNFADSDHLQSTLALTVMQPHIGAAGDVVESVPHGHHSLVPAPPNISAHILLRFDI